MKRGGYRRGSVLILALWIIAVLSVMVVSFAFEARQQAGIDIYVRERSRVNRLVDSGRMIGEAILLDYENAPEPEIKGGIPEWKEHFDRTDRWVVEKYRLKNVHECVVGPLRLDDDEENEEGDEEPATLTVEIAFESATPRWDINSFCEGQNTGWVSMFQSILLESGIGEELEVEVEDARRSGSSKHNLMNLLLASWKDWRDEDETVSRGPLTESEYDPQEDDGAERSWYEERYEEDDIPMKDRRYPPDGKGGPIKKLEELSFIRGFCDFPSVLFGGYLYDGTELEEKIERGSPENPRLQGILNRFKVSGGAKIEINDRTTAQDLSLIPGICVADPDDDSEREESAELVSAILAALREKPEDADEVDETLGYYPYKDFADLCKRVEDYGCSVDIPEEVRDYLVFPGGSSSASTQSASGKTKSGKNEDITKFRMTITGESMGMKYVVQARCCVFDKKVQYVEWSENESAK